MSSRQRWTSTAAAAALLIAAFSMWSLDGRAPRQHVSSEVVRTAGRDLNRDGRVDVLDVFALARAVESRSNSAATDVNGDGVTDRRDVDAIASQAVALGHA